MLAWSESRAELRSDGGSVRTVPARVSGGAVRHGAGVRGSAGSDRPRNRRRDRQGHPPVRPAGESRSPRPSPTRPCSPSCASTCRRTSRTVRAAFEDLRPGERYGLVYAAAALHWTNPEGRWSRMAALLEPGGVLRLVRRAGPAGRSGCGGNRPAARAPFLDSDEIPSPDGTPPEHGHAVAGYGAPAVGVVHRRSAVVIETAPDDECSRLRRPPVDRLGLSCSSPAPEQEQVYPPDHAGPAGDGRDCRRPHGPSRASALPAVVPR